MTAAGGRQTPASAGLAPSPALRLGIDLGGTKIHAVVLDAEGRVCWEERRATPQDDYLATLGALANTVGTARTALGGAHLTVGVGGPGLIYAAGLSMAAAAMALGLWILPNRQT